MREFASPRDETKVSPVRATECVRCGLTLRRALLFAAMRDLGASTSVDPIQCDLPNGEMADHDFQPRKTA